MKPTLTIFALICVLALSVSAQDNAKKSDAKPAEVKSSNAALTVDQLLEKYVHALGGNAAIQKLTTRVAKGTIQVPSLGLSLNSEFFSKAPNKRLNVLDVPNYGLILEGYDGTVGWSQNPQTGVNDKSGDDLTLFKRESEFHRDLKFKELYSTLTLKGKTKLAEREVHVLEATPKAGAMEKLYFDAKTFLLVRRDSEFMTPQDDKAAQEVYFEDYKEVDGVKLAFIIRRESPTDLAFTLKLTEVKHNQPIDDAKFEKPAAK